MAGNFAGVWQTGTGKQDFAVDLSFEEFAAKHQALSGDGPGGGLRLASFRTYEDGGQRRWAAIWREGTGRQLFAADLTWDGFETQHQSALAAGARIELLQTYQDGLGQEFAQLAEGQALNEETQQFVRRVINYAA